MRKRGWKNQIAIFLYDRHIGGSKIYQMKKSFQEVADILHGETKENVLKKK